MDETTRLAAELYSKIGNIGFSEYLALTDKDKQDLNKLYEALNDFLK
jgi:hypothetical protein